MIHQTAADLENEEAIALEFASMFPGVVLQKNVDDEDAVDRRILRDGWLIGFAEIKRRHYQTTRLVNVWMDVHKWNVCRIVAVRFSVPFYFVVKFDDALRCYCWKDGDDFGTTVGFRRVPRVGAYNADRDVVVPIPMKRFLPPSEVEL